MPAFLDTFDRDPGPLGNGWLPAAGEMRIRTTGRAEWVFGGQGLYDGWDANNYAEPTAGVGWQNKEADAFPHAAWKGTWYDAGTDTRYSYQAFSDLLFLGEDRTSRGDVEVTASAFGPGGSVGLQVSWEVGGSYYGTQTTVASSFDVLLSGAAIPSALDGQERYIVLRTIGGAFVDRFRLPYQAARSESFFGGDYAGVMRPMRANASGRWEAEMVGQAEGPQWDNWGDMMIIVAADGLTEDASSQYVRLDLDVGGWVAVHYKDANGDDILQGATNSNSVEPNAFSYQGFPYPDESPDLSFVYNVSVNPTTGVVTVTVNGVVRGTVTIPTDEITRMRELYASGEQVYAGFGLSPFIFGEARETFMVESFATTVPHPPGSVAPGRSRGAFVAPAF